MNEIVTEIIHVLEDNGLVRDNEINEENYKEIIVSIADQVDSLIYISVLVGIEKLYKIELPDELIERNILYDIDSFVAIIDTKRKEEKSLVLSSEI